MIDTDITSSGRPSGDPQDPAWWWTAEEHHNALLVLQLRLRRDILKFIEKGPKSLEEIGEKFSLSPEKASYHLSMLIAALVVRSDEKLFSITPTGVLYLENVEGRQ